MTTRLPIRCAPTLLVLSMLGCSVAQESPPEAEAIAVPESVAEAATSAPAVCQADGAWVTDPTQPAEVASTESFCDFYQFSWQWFLSQVSPADASNPTGDRVFETNRVVDPAGGADQCSAAAISGRALAGTLVSQRVLKPDDFETQQADGNPLYDQSTNILYYNMWYSPEECQATSAGFVPGTMEIKTSWRVLASADPSYYTMPATLGDGSNVTLGLVGFHLVNWTSAHPEMIWASFEHKSNAPLCDGSSATSGWTLTSDAAAQCLADNPQPSGGTISPNCASYNFNTSPNNSGPFPSTGTPDEVCRLYANGNEPGTSVNGNDNAANLLAIQQLNEALVGDAGLLTGLPSTDPMAVWKHYEMVGGLWTKNGADSGNSPVPTKHGAGDPNSPQRGSLELTNMTMETFEQGATSSIPNCFGCHGFSSASPLEVSHIANRFLLPASVTGASTLSADDTTSQ